MPVDCPICKRHLENVSEDDPYRPFCSKRCKLVDLDNWLGEVYRISSPVGPSPPDDEGLLH